MQFKEFFISPCAPLSVRAVDERTEWRKKTATKNCMQTVCQLVNHPQPHSARTKHGIVRTEQNMLQMINNSNVYYNHFVAIFVVSVVLTFSVFNGRWFCHAESALFAIYPHSLSTHSHSLPLLRLIYFCVCVFFFPFYYPALAVPFICSCT